MEHQPSDDPVGAIRGFFDDEERAVEEFFDPKRPTKISRRAASTANKPTHYKVISISMYTDDIARLEELVKEAKALGHTRANKSLLIREALRQLDLNALPRQR